MKEAYRKIKHIKYKKIIMKFYITSLICLFVLNVFAQRKPVTRNKPVSTKNIAAKNNKTPKPIRIKMNATYSVQKGIIKIRWAPNSEEGWRICNLFGYVVERFTVAKNNAINEKPEMIRLFGIVPDSLNKWEKLIVENDNAAVMAQALYGEEFLLDLNNKSTTKNAGASLLSKAEENKQRFIFGMYAADLDYDIAEKAALGFTDLKIQPNEKYLYRIYPAAPKEYVKSDTALLLLSLNDTTELPKTSEIFAEPSNKSTVLSWDFERTKNYYNAFYIERKIAEQEDFELITPNPYTSFSQINSNKYAGNTISYTDTGLIEGKQYFYRIRGKTIFNTLGPWSQIVETKCLPLLEGVPGIQGIRLDAKGKPIISWYFEDSIREKVKAFELNYSATGSGNFLPVKTNIDPMAKETYLPDTLASGYLIVKAVSKEGISRTSFPYLFQPEDSTAPAPPIGLKVLADSTGVITLSWLPNTEKDLLGYKVFRTLINGAEKAILVDTICYSTEYKDTLDLKLKNRKAYYTVTALDFRYNQSKESKEVTVVKPDIIPPTAPVFEDFILAEGSVEIKWINSTDEDIKETQLKRRDENTAEWKTVFTTKNNKDTNYKDKDVKPFKKYSYRLYAIDSSNLTSNDAQELNVQALPVINRKAITKLDAQVDREKRLLYLNWQLAKDIKIKTIEIFRSENKEPISLYKVLPANMLDMIENELIVNTKYKYGVRVQFVTGEYSDIVIKEVNY